MYYTVIDKVCLPGSRSTINTHKVGTILPILKKIITSFMEMEYNVLQTALLFKWKYFLTKSHGVSQDLRISSVLIGCYSGHMTKNETLRDFRLNETLQK